MTQNVLAICHKCKIGRCIGNFSSCFIDVDVAFDFFVEHKGHRIQIIGDDGGWEVYVGKLVEKGYEIDW